MCLAVLPNREMAGRSSVWESFNKVDDGTSAKCKICEKKLKYNGSTTTNLREHLSRKHPPLATSEARATASHGVEAMRRFLGHQIIPDKRKNTITSLIASWCTGSLRPLSIVGDPGFVELMKFVEPGYTVPSRNTVGAVVRKDYEELRKALLVSTQCCGRDCCHNRPVVVQYEPCVCDIYWSPHR